MWRNKPRAQRVKDYLNSFGEGDPADITLTVTEKELIIPKFQLYMIANDLCSPLGEKLNECMSRRSPWFCIVQRFHFTTCINTHDYLPAYRDRYIDDFIELRSKYRSTQDEKYLLELKKIILTNDTRYAHVNRVPVSDL